MVEIVPSILSADLNQIGNQISELENAGINAIHIDIMDGYFVSNISFGWNVIEAIRSITKIRLDAHLMIIKPERFIKQCINSGANRLIIHAEASSNCKDSLELALSLGAEVGLALSPSSDINSIMEYLDIIKIVQVMGVYPGLGGQRFIPAQLHTVKDLNSIFKKRQLSNLISVDGGVNKSLAPVMVKAGAEILVAGSSIFNRTNSISENIELLLSSSKKN